MTFTEAKNNRLIRRVHYLTRAQEDIDRQITELREKRADIGIEIQRINRRIYGPAEIPVLRTVEGIK